MSWLYFSNRATSWFTHLNMVCLRKLKPESIFCSTLCGFIMPLARFFHLTKLNLYVKLSFIRPYTLLIRVLHLMYYNSSRLAFTLGQFLWLNFSRTLGQCHHNASLHLNCPSWFSTTRPSHFYINLGLQ